MEQLKELKTKVLLKEYEHLCLKLDWMKLSINENEGKFMEYVHNIIDNNEELRELCHQDDNKPIYVENSPIEVERVEKDIVLKKMYRDIVKKTHPDVIDDSKLNSIYTQVVDLYDNNDILGMYLIYDKVGIEYTIDINTDVIIEGINKIKGRIHFLENSYVYQWIDVDDKDKVVLDYIRTLLI